MSIIDDDQDRSLLAAVARGDLQAFWTLWLRHRDRLFRICMRELNGNRVDAEDANGQAMMHAQQTLPRFAASVQCAASWLARLTVNVCRDLRRARLRGARAEVELAHRDSDRRRGLLFHPGREELLDAEAGRDLDPASLIAQLPERLRGVFMLRIVKNQSYEVIANQFGLTCVTARKRVQEARARLRAMRLQPPVAIVARGDGLRWHSNHP
jgi:RNA polymerase sigma-70 factor (ECF subfamily)